MKHPENIQEVASLQPDYLGFIFYEESPRNFEGIIPETLNSIKRVGVFVDASIDFVLENIKKHNLDVIQFHGNESHKYLEEFKKRFLVERSRDLPIIWKVFSIKDKFDFNRLEPYEGIVDAFLFDTKGKEKGGNGYTFNWDALKEYPSKTPIVLSGGIGLNEIDQLKEILNTDLPIQIIDLNSKLEIKPGLKNVEKVKEFIKEISLAFRF
ncbi:phosphoribosylanthranilate isomerase [Spongiivirga citrea]|uniref:N-(5'-phosphoribosyl)anthranilate isomerase n=2 Tax=Spongiivirga citrea TaxID=1481457 RepID=A0A6M0CNA3_9FLAO|nr:phosphoribosylanthranilate isomerase [Spongiivirga citrea]